MIILIRMIKLGRLIIHFRMIILIRNDQDWPSLIILDQDDYPGKGYGHTIPHFQNDHPDHLDQAWAGLIRSTQGDQGLVT